MTRDEWDAAALDALRWVGPSMAQPLAIAIQGRGDSAGSLKCALFRLWYRGLVEPDADPRTVRRVRWRIVEVKE